MIELYRLFPWDKKTRNNHTPGGPFYVARAKQGPGRHDIPHLDGVLYASVDPVSVVAEYIQGFRGTRLRKENLVRPDDLVYGLAHFKLEGADLLDLDNPATLVKHNLRPSQITTRNRATTRQVSERLYQTGARGILWPSSLESSWINATLYYDRVKTSLSVLSDIRELSLQMPELRTAAETLGIEIDL